VEALKQQCWFAWLLLWIWEGCFGFGKRGLLCRSDVGEEVKRTELDLYLFMLEDHFRWRRISRFPIAFTHAYADCVHLKSILSWIDRPDINHTSSHQSPSQMSQQDTFQTLKSNVIKGFKTCVLSEQACISVERELERHYRRDTGSAEPGC